MLNWIIHLQTVLKIITNQTATDFDLLWFSTLGRCKSLIGIIGTMLLTLLFPCLAPLYIRTVESTIETAVKTTKVMALYEALSQEDDDDL